MCGVGAYRFQDGLKTLGVLEKIQQHPEAFKPLLCHAPCPLWADRIENLFSIRLSPEGSNKRVAEEAVVTFWRDYLQDAEGMSVCILITSRNAFLKAHLQLLAMKEYPKLIWSS